MYIKKTTKKNKYLFYSQANFQFLDGKLVKGSDRGEENCTKIERVQDVSVFFKCQHFELAVLCVKAT